MIRKMTRDRLPRDLMSTTWINPMTKSIHRNEAINFKTQKLHKTVDIILQHICICLIIPSVSQNKLFYVLYYQLITFRMRTKMVESLFPRCSHTIDKHTCLFKIELTLYVFQSSSKLISSLNSFKSAISLADLFFFVPRMLSTWSYPSNKYVSSW